MRENLEKYFDKFLKEHFDEEADDEELSDEDEAGKRL
jgi:hypothetical protein